ncbi:MAG TPA: hypothetical protein VGI79_17675 [Caulobacteraceae bacterium]
MRATAGLLLIALLGAGAPAALAAPLNDAALAALNRAAFASPSAPDQKKSRRLVVAHFSQGQGATPLAAPADSTPLAADALFASQQSSSHGLTAWRGQSVAKLLPSGAVDTVSLTVGEVSRGPGGVVLAAPGGRLAADPQTVGVAYDRAWPSALRVAGGRYDLDVSPHAGLAMSDTYGSALAGASVRLQLPVSKRERLASLGFAPSSPSSATDKGRWFLFAEGSGELVGVHLSRDGRNLMPRAALTLDDGVQRDVVSDTQAGVGWRKGGVQASFGYVHREIRNDASVAANHQMADIKGDMVALTFSFRPH